MKNQPFPFLPAIPPIRSAPALPSSPDRPRPSRALLQATVLELLILAGHAVLYPTGVAQERRATTRTRPGSRTHERPCPALPERAADRRPEHPPVLLLHGFIDNRSVFVLLRRSLRRHGRRQVEALNYSPLTCDIRAAAALLGRHIEEICERTGHERIDVVGHSLGGLIARYYVQRLGGDARVRTLVTLGTPHSGTRAIPLMTVHPIVRQMRPDSAVIEELTRPAPHCGTRFISFWSDLDQLMIPLETARIDHPDLLTRNVMVSGIGHLALPVHSAVATAVRRELAADVPAADSSEAASVA
jgi:pimeloyl-ACP methyl ester carboxylesterase